MKNLGKFIDSPLGIFLFWLAMLLLVISDKTSEVGTGLGVAFIIMLWIAKWFAIAIGGFLLVLIALAIIKWSLLILGK